RCRFEITLGCSKQAATARADPQRPWAPEREASLLEPLDEHACPAELTEPEQGLDEVGVVLPRCGLGDPDPSCQLVQLRESALRRGIVAERELEEPERAQGMLTEELAARDEGE